MSDERINKLILDLDSNLTDESDILSRLRDGSLAIEELAEKLGCSLPTLSRKLNAMQHGGVIEVYSRHCVMFVRRSLKKVKAA